MKKTDIIITVCICVVMICTLLIVAAHIPNDHESDTVESTSGDTYASLEIVIESTQESSTAYDTSAEELSADVAQDPFQPTTVTTTTTTATTQTTKTTTTTATTTTATTTTTKPVTSLIDKITSVVEEITSGTTRNESQGMTDLDYLATAVFYEAGADYVSDEARQYVAEVVLNRVNSSLFPNTIHGVLTQRKQYGTFYLTGVPKLSKTTAGVERAYRIAEDVLSGTRAVPSNVIYQAEFPQGSGVWKYIDGIYFCYA